MHLERPDRGHQHRAGRREPAVAAIDVEELLGAEFEAEARLGDDDIRYDNAARVAVTLFVPWAMLAKGPPWTNAGAPSVVCTRFGLIAWLMRAAMAPTAPIARLTAVPSDV